MTEYAVSSPPSTSDVPSQWLESLAAADTVDALAAGLLAVACAQPGCSGGWIVQGGEDHALSLVAGDWTAATDVQRELASAALHDGAVHGAGDGRLVAAALPPSPYALVLACAPGRGPEVFAALAAPLKIAGRMLSRMLKMAELEASNARLVHSEQLQRALFDISNLAGSDRPMSEMLREIHAIIGTLMYAENFFLVLRDLQRETIRFLYFADVEDTAPRDPEREIPLASRENTLTWYVIRDGKPLMGDTPALLKQISGPLNIHGPDSNDWLGVPMLREGQVRGALVVQSYQPGIRYDANDMALLSFVGSHVLTALERKQGKVELERSVQLRTQELADANRGLQLEILERQRAERLQAVLFQLAQMATADISQAAFYQRVHQVIGDLLNAENFFIALLTEEGDALEFPYYVDARGRSGQTRPLGRGLSEYVMRQGDVFMGTSEDITALARRGEIELQVAGDPALSWLGAPLLAGGETIGLVAVQSYTPTVGYGPADRELLSFVASQLASSLSRRRAAQIQQRSLEQLEERVAARTQELRNEIRERERIQEQLKHEVMHDALTGLPNRGYLRDRLERVLGLLRREPDRKGALLYLDIDRFKVVNDSLGHLAGDEMLREVARRLQACVREPDLVSRLSGDEFAILLEEVPVPETAVKVAQRLLEHLGQPLLVAGKELEPAASIGIAITDASYLNADDVLRDADIALYRAKELGRKRFELFDASLQKHAVDVLEMERDLRVALQHDQFVPYFQPIQRLDDGEVMGFEALIRWNHPTRGLLGPGQFLPIAEDSGSIEAIDWWMFEHSCALMAGRGAHHYVTINVSPLHFRREDFSQRLTQMLQRTGLAPSRLVIEVTEGSLLDDPEGVRDVLARLRDEGIGAALDDFGTGYSSLSYLHTFPLRSVKIDRSFVSRLGVGAGSSDAVVVSILALARALGMEAVAEGIETAAQRDTLLAMGCRYGQGYLLGRPAPIGHWSTEANDP